MSIAPHFVLFKVLRYFDGRVEEAIIDRIIESVKPIRVEEKKWVVVISDDFKEEFMNEYLALAKTAVLESFDCIDEIEIVDE